MLIPFGFLASAGGAGVPAYELISTAFPTTTTVTFSSIPSIYKHLQLRVVAKTTDASTGECWPALRFNSDAGSNYAIHQINGNGTSVGSQAALSRTSGQIAILNDNYNSTSMFGAAVVDILDYTSTTKNKTTKSLGGSHAPSSKRISLYSNVWLNTSAVTSITLLFATYGGNFVSGSRVSLYGIKG